MQSKTAIASLRSSSSVSACSGEAESSVVLVALDIPSWEAGVDQPPSLLAVVGFAYQSMDSHAPK